MNTKYGMKWKRWRWIEDGLLPLALTVMRVCSLWLWLALAQHLLLPSYGRTLLPAWMIGALLVGSTAVTRLALSRTRTLHQARFIVAGLGVATLIFLLWWQLYRPVYTFWDAGWIKAWGHSMLFWVGEVPPSYLLLPAIVYLWLRGSLDGSRRLDQRAVMGAFGGGCVALVLLMLTSLLDRQALPPETGGLVFLFFAMAMVALALAGLKAARLPVAANDGGVVTRLNRYWASSVATIIAGLLLLGLLLNALYAPEVMSSVLEWSWSGLSRVIILLIKAVSLLLYPVLLFLAIVVPRLYYAIIGMFARIFGRNSLPDPEAIEAFRPDNTAEGATSIIENLPDAWRWLAFAVVFLLIGLAFALALRRLAADDDDEDVEETREFIISGELLLAQLGQWWPKLLGRAPKMGLGPFLPLAGEPETRRIIRQAYQKLLTAARQQGQARLRQQTPGEYGRQLTQLWPGSREAIDVLTTRYVQARYGIELPTPEQAEQARRAWQQLRAEVED